MSLGDLIVQKAISHLGETEHPLGSNRGPLPDKVLAYVGIPPGSPWCAAYACFCLHEAVAATHGALSSHQTGWPMPRTGSSGELEEWGERYKRIIEEPEQARAGDFFTVLDPPGHEGPTGYHHTGIIERVTFAAGEYLARTIEGNANDRVKRGIRSFDKITVIRPY